MLRNSSKIYLICLKLRVFFNDFYKKQINFRNFWVNKQIWAHAALWGHKSVSLRPCSEIHTPSSHSVRFNFAQEENWWRPHAFCIVKKKLHMSTGCSAKSVGAAKGNRGAKYPPRLHPPQVNLTTSLWRASKKRRKPVWASAESTPTATTPSPTSSLLPVHTQTGLTD